MADANDDAKVDLADAVFVMRHLFQGGQEPARVNTTRVLKTGQVLCFDDFEAKESCEEATQAGFFGQDAHYRDTVGASREYVLEQDLDQDGVQEGVKDLRTGLMWERRPERITNSVGGTTFDLADGNAKIAELNANAGTQAALRVQQLAEANDWRVNVGARLLAHRSANPLPEPAGIRGPGNLLVE
jgi:hypothetical protein